MGECCVCSFKKDIVLSTPLATNPFKGVTRQKKASDPFETKPNPLSQPIHEKTDLGALVEILNVFCKERSRMANIGAIEPLEASKDISRARKLLVSLGELLVK